MPADQPADPTGTGDPLTDRATSVNVDRLVRDHMRRDPNAEHAFLNDPVYSAQVRFLRSMLRLVDEVLNHEGVPAPVRMRVVRAVLYGSPDGADAIVRINDREAAALQLARVAGPPGVPLNDVPLNDVLRGAPEPLRKEPA